MTIDGTNSLDEPFSVVFSYGTPPFSTSVLFREVQGGAREDFIAQEHKEQKGGQYAGDVTEKKYDLANGLYAIEFVRQTPAGEIYYFVFPSPKTKKFYAFWHMTSDMADPDRKTLAAYREMIETLVITE